MTHGEISRFLRHHFRHFNSATVIDASDAYRALLDRNGKMFLAMAGAMSTAELGVSLAEMIRRDKVHGICCTGANLEEDLFNLVAGRSYVRVPNYGDLSPVDELDLLQRGLNRVTDTCIPENVMRRVEQALLTLWRDAEASNRRFFPHEYLYTILREETLRNQYQSDPRDSWLHAAMEKNLPIFVPGWADSSTGNMFAAQCIQGTVKRPQIVKEDIDYLIELASWYETTSSSHPVGFLQIGGGIAGDFSICVVPMLRQDLKRTSVPLWNYFCQISDSTTSYGSYSGAVPNEKITWGKLAADTPRFMIESDATIVAPLMFALVLNS